MKKNPELTAKTRNYLLTAFRNYYSKTEYRKITVKDITGCAGYNRSTFYEYFNDINAMRKYSEDLILSDISAWIDELSKEEITDESLTEFTNTIFDHHIFQMEILLGPDGDPLFYNELKNTLKPLGIAIISYQADATDLDIICEMAASTVANMIKYMSNHPEIPHNKIIAHLHTFVRTGVLSQKSILQY